MPPVLGPAVRSLRLIMLAVLSSSTDSLPSGVYVIPPKHARMHVLMGDRLCGSGAHIDNSSSCAPIGRTDGPVHCTQRTVCARAFKSLQLHAGRTNTRTHTYARDYRSRINQAGARARTLHSSVTPQHFIWSGTCARCSRRAYALYTNFGEPFNRAGPSSLQPVQALARIEQDIVI